MHDSKYKELAEKYGKTELEIKKICNSQFEYTRQVIMEGKDEQVMLQYLGKFLVRPYRRESMAKRRKKMKEYNDSKK